MSLVPGIRTDKFTHKDFEAMLLKQPSQNGWTNYSPLEGYLRAVAVKHLVKIHIHLLPGETEITVTATWGKETKKTLPLGEENRLDSVLSDMICEVWTRRPGDEQ